MRDEFNHNSRRRDSSEYSTPREERLPVEYSIPEEYPQAKEQTNAKEYFESGSNEKLNSTCTLKNDLYDVFEE